MYNIANQNQRHRFNAIKKAFAVLPIALALVFCMLPNCASGIPYASDEPFHLARIMSLADALKEGIFPVKVHPNLCYGLGYGVGFFYDNALLYFPAFLILAGISLESAYKIFIFCVFIAIAATMYYSCRRLSGNSIVAAFSAALYLLCNRIVGQLYVDFTIGNLCGAIFLPLSVAGIWIWIKEKKGLSMFIVGFSGLLYAHAITTVLAFSVCALIAVANIHTIFRQKAKLIGLVLASAYTFLLTMAYWLPMWQQFHVQTYKSQAPWTTEEQNIVSIAGLVTDTRGVGILIICAFIIDIVFAAIISRWQKNEWSDKKREILTFMILGTVYMLLPCSYLFWHLVNLHVTLIQFPARLFLPASVLILFAFSIEVSVLCGDGENRMPRHRFVIICTCLCIVGCLNISLTVYPDSFMHTDSKVLEEVENYAIAGAGAGQEWLPIESNLDELKDNTDTAIAEDGSIVKGEKEDQNTKYVFQISPNHQYYDVPYIYYRGYIATDENGTEYEVDKNPQNGLVRILLPEEQQNTAIITVTYHDTRYTMMSYMVSLISAAAGIVYIATHSRKVSDVLMVSIPV